MFLNSSASMDPHAVGRFIIEERSPMLSSSVDRIMLARRLLPARIASIDQVCLCTHARTHARTRRHKGDRYAYTSYKYTGNQW